MKAPYAPYYDPYVNHVFAVDHQYPAPFAEDHVWLRCVDDPEIQVDGCVDVKLLTDLGKLIEDNGFIPNADSDVRDSDNGNLSDFNELAAIRSQLVQTLAQIDALMKKIQK